MTSTTLSQKQLNFARFSIVCVDINKLTLKDILTIFIKPADLHEKIKKCPSLLGGKYKLNPDQRRKCCYNSLNSPDYSKFDITLLYKLIRNLCPSLEPTKKWGSKPSSNDLDVGDDIERIKNLRNTNFAHSELAEISVDEFKNLWSDVKCMIKRCQQFTTSNGCTTDYNKMLIDLEMKTFTVDEYTSSKDRSGAIYVYGDSDVLCGETARFEAEITLEQDGYMPVSWDRVDGLVRKQIDFEDKKYRGSDTRKLIINNVWKNDEAGYQAVISRNHDVKILSNKVYLRPKGDLPCLEELNATTKNGEIYIHYVFNVSKNSPTVNDIKWTKDESFLELPSNKYRGGGLADNSVTILRPGEDDKGLYTCTVSNAVGPVSKSIKLDIPSAEILPTTNLKVMFGSDTRLDCSVSGNPSANKVEWQNSLDGTKFYPTDNDEDKYFGSSSDPCSPFLLVRNATLYDQQYYRVIVSNEIGKYTSSKHFLQVTGGKPNMSEVICTCQSHSVKLKCHVFLYDESPALDDVYWTKNGMKIDIEKTNGKYSGVDINDPSLIINNVNHNDAGDYQLIAVNAVGETESELIVLGVPEVLLETCVEKEDSSLWFTMTIKSVPVPHAVQWHIKENNSDTFEPINVNAAEYIGTSNSFPHPVLVINHLEKLENCTFEIEVKNRIGEGKKAISGTTFQDELKGEQKTLGKVYADGGSDIPFSIWLSELAEKFPKEKIYRLKFLIPLFCKTEDVTELENAKTAEDCFTILLKEKIFSRSDVMIMQFLLKRTNCEELEKECIEYAKKQKAMYFYEKPPENGYRNVRFHVVRYLQQFSKEDETKIRETVSKIVRCPIEQVRVHGYLYSSSFFIVLSIKEIYIERLFAMQQHDKEILSKLSVDYFKDDFNTVRLERTAGITESSKELCIADKGQNKLEPAERPVLESNLDCLTTACLLKHEAFLYEELEPRDLCDFLFKEGAVDILSHDRITETSQRRKQVKFLIKTIMENKHDCFHFFLYILQRKDYGYICQTLAEYTSSTYDGVQNEPIQLRLAVQYDDGTEMHQTLYQNIHFFDTYALREMISRGHIIMERATSISVEVQIRHISDEPDPEQLDDKEYKKVLRNVYKMLEKAETFMAKVKDSANPLQINIQVHSFYSEKPKSPDIIWKRISSNLKNILDEMQLPLARETLSKCTGDVDEIWKKMLPTNGSRRQRMFEFIQFILQRRENRIEFERILKNNGLKKVIDTWTEKVNSETLRVLLESCKVEIPNYPKQSFAKILLEGPRFTDFVQGVRSLARGVVLCKNFEEKEKKPGTVMVFEVTVTNEDNEVVIDEKDPEDFVEFFEKTQKDLVKVILIEGIWGSVSETKKRVYQNYQQYIESGRIYLQHESEQYAEVSKLSALQKIKSCKQEVELIRASIPLDNIQDIIENAVDRALTEERIKRLCCDASIDGIGSTYSGAYYVRFFLTLHKIKSDLKKQTIESIKECLGSEICAEIRKNLKMELKSRLPLGIILDALDVVNKVVLASILIVIASIFNPFAGVVAVVATGLFTFFSAQDVNSRSWREGVAMEIFTEVSNNKYTIIRELSSHLWQTFNVTSDHLKTVAENLEDYRRSIAYINLNDTCS